MLDSSIVNVAAEPIARELGASLTVVQWTVSGYLLALGAGLAGTAFLARRFGTLPVYRASVVAFTAASALCALAPGAGVLGGARIVPGLVARPPGQRPAALFDRPGLILLATGLTGLLLGASQGASAGWTAPAAWVPLVS